MLMEDTIYNENDIRKWHEEFLDNCPKGKFKLMKYIESYKQFYNRGKLDNISIAETSNERMSLKLGDQFPNFFVKTTIGDIDLYNWIGDSWCIFFSHPADFTPVCTTELSRVANLKYEFVRRNVKCIALSCDSIENHLEWIKDLEVYGQCQSEQFFFPIIEDANRILAKRLGMIDCEQYDSKGLPLTARAVFVIDPDKKLKASILYPATTGRNFNEILRLIDGLQLSSRLPVVTPVDWQLGDKVMVSPNVTDEQIKRHLPQGVQIQQGLPSGKNYIRLAEV